MGIYLPAPLWALDELLASAGVHWIRRQLLRSSVASTHWKRRFQSVRMGALPACAAAQLLRYRVKLVQRVPIGVHCGSSEVTAFKPLVISNVALQVWRVCLYFVIYCQFLRVNCCWKRCFLGSLMTGFINLLLNATWLLVGEFLHACSLNSTLEGCFLGVNPCF